MAFVADYPSPPVEKDRPSPPASPVPTSKMKPITPAASLPPERQQHRFVGRGQPPRNAEDSIFCAHSECKHDPPTFKRLCEWNRHMDRHDRPYRCSEPGCDRGQGFTYLGGLLRHEREVHDRNRSSRQVFWCTDPNCSRSNSHPFTRAENLKEHVRRRHLSTSTTVGKNISETQSDFSTQLRASPTTMRKRSRSSFEESRARSPVLDDDGIDAIEQVSEQVKRLKRIITDKDARIRELEAELVTMTQRRRSSAF